MPVKLKLKMTKKNESAYIRLLDQDNLQKTIYGLYFYRPYCEKNFKKWQELVDKYLLPYNELTGNGFSAYQFIEKYRTYKKIEGVYYGKERNDSLWSRIWKKAKKYFIYI